MADYSLNTNEPLSVESWMDLLDKDVRSDQDQTLFMQDLQEHPEWVNERDQYQQTPLMDASCQSNTNIIKELISKPMLNQSRSIYYKS